MNKQLYAICFLSFYSCPSQRVVWWGAERHWNYSVEKRFEIKVIVKHVISRYITLYQDGRLVIHTYIYIYNIQYNKPPTPRRLWNASDVAKIFHELSPSEEKYLPTPFHLSSSVWLAVNRYRALICWGIRQSTRELLVGWNTKWAVEFIGGLLLTYFSIAITSEIWRALGNPERNSDFEQQRRNVTVNCLNLYQQQPCFLVFFSACWLSSSSRAPCQPSTGGFLQVRPLWRLPARPGGLLWPAVATGLTVLCDVFLNGFHGDTKSRLTFSLTY